MQRPRLAGHKLTSFDGTGIVQIRPDLIGVSQLAPYRGWEGFIGRTRSALGRAAPLFSSRPLTRIGLRYINRIDIPAPTGVLISHIDYLGVGISDLPFAHGPLGTMSFNLATTVDDGCFGLVLNCGRVAAPLIDQVSLLFDIDVSSEINVPRSREAMWDQLGEMRQLKNQIFESCVTDQARSLFQ